jgi:voltage-gated potassium channel Kch
MRAPLIALIVIYALAIAGLVAIPGTDEQGQSVRMDFLHAFYFVSYTATTIGFGEIPRAFNAAQRLWVTFCIYLTVVGWSYAFVKLLGLLQDPWFREAILTQQFKHQVNRLTEPFFLVCSYGDTGTLLCQALNDLGRRFIVVDPNPDRIAEVDVAGYRMDCPALAADARSPATLKLAGLTHPSCLAVLALTDDDCANLSIAAAARLLRPEVPVLCRAEQPAIASDMALFGVEHVIDPHRKFGADLALAIQSPGSYQLQQWLTAMPGTLLGEQTEPPRGLWLIFGDGLFARAVAQALRNSGIDTQTLKTVESDDIGAVAVRDVPFNDKEVPRTPVAACLDRSAIREAAGFVAGTDDDTRNLAIVMAARQFNPKLFFVLRQNRKVNQPLFRALNSDIGVMSSEIVVHECLAHLTTPLLPRFIERVGTRDDAWADATLIKLRNCISREVPAVWTVDLSEEMAPAVLDFLTRGGETLRVDHLIRDPDKREGHLRCVALLIVRPQGAEVVMPSPEAPIGPGDRLLFAGTDDCRHRQSLSLLNINVLRYVYSGRQAPSGWLMRKLLG